MIRLYTEKHLIEGKQFIRSVDAAFNSQVYATSFDSIDLSIMQEIDSAELLDANTGFIKTPYGVCSIKNLSTGCKAVLYLRYMIKNNIDAVLNASECGENAFNLLCKYCNDSGVNIYMSQCDSIGINNRYEFLLNNTIKTSEVWLEV